MADNDAILKEILQEISGLTEACMMLQRGLMEQNKLLGFLADQIGRVLNETRK